MVRKDNLKKIAIDLRQQGFSYSEILAKISVAKSTLSLWLRDVDLSKRQKQRITEKKIISARKGGEARKMKRLDDTAKIKNRARKDIQHISKRELWLIGVMLYWAEGTKEKENHPGSGVQFTNSDPQMIVLFLKWLREICNIKKNQVYFDIFIHTTARERLGEIIQYWAKITEFSRDNFSHIYFKKNKLNTKRHNTGNAYYGVVKVRVKASSILSRKIAGWTEGVIEYGK